METKTFPGQNLPGKELFRTVIGSHMWGMDTPDSDHDIMIVYQYPTLRILEGWRIPETMPFRKHENDLGEWEFQFMEIGHLVDLLIKGNCNAIWAVMSPHVITRSVEYDKLRDIVSKNLAASTYWSVRGMAISQLADITKRKGSVSEEKALRSAFRTLQFGINLLDGKGVAFEPAPPTTNRDEIDALLDMIDAAYTRTKLPKSTNALIFREYLGVVRTLDSVRANASVAGSR
jgi:hypothetical protein